MMNSNPRATCSRFDRRALWALILTLSVLQGCQSWPQTYGEVSVGRPQVYTRERLQSERAEEVQWLRTQLDRPVETGFQGIQDTREAAAYVFGLTVELDLAKKRAAALEREQASTDRGRADEIAAINHQIDRLRAEQRLEQVKADIAKQSGSGTGTGTDPKPTTPEANADLQKIAAEIAKVNARLGDLEKKLTVTPKDNLPTAGKARDALKDSSTVLADPGNARLSGAQPTTRDRFEDEAAFRDLVTARIRERILDDTHDLSGNALYELKFDVSLVPGENSRKKFVASIKIHKDDWHPVNFVKGGFPDRLREIAQEDINVLRRRMSDRWAEYRLSRQWHHRIVSYLNNAEVGAAYAKCGISKSESEARVSAPLRSYRTPDAAPPGTVSTARMRNDLAAEASCLVAAYVKKRIGLALGRYFGFEIRMQDVAGQKPEPFIEVQMAKPGGECKVFDAKDTSLSKKKSACTPDEHLIDRLADIQALQQPWVATVEPKEYAQNISEVASLRKIRQITAALQYGDGAGRDAKAGADIYKEDQDLLQAIRRQPLAASFVRGEREFGWVLGPKFEIENNRPVFKHATARYSFSASVVVPGWFTRIQLSGCGYWIDNEGSRSMMTPLFGTTCLEKATVNLPGAYRPILHALLASDLSIFSDPEIFLLPQADRNGYVYLQERSNSCVDANDRSCEQSLVIEGRELWRNPAVFLGERKADRVEPLPSNRGIVAYFRGLELPPGRLGLQLQAQDLVVSTSAGQDRLPHAVTVVPAYAEAPAPFARLQTQVLEPDASKALEIAFDFAASAMPRAFHEVRAIIKKLSDPGEGRAVPGVAEITLGRARYQVTSLADVGLGSTPEDLSIDLQLRLLPGGPWYSVTHADSRFATFFPTPAARQVTVETKSSVDLAKVPAADDQVSRLRAKLSATLPANLALFFRGNPGLERALERRGGEVEFRVVRDDDPIAIRATRARVANADVITADRNSLGSSLDDLVPAPGAAKVAYTWTLVYRIGGQPWIAVRMNNPAPVLEISAPNKPDPPKNTGAAKPATE